MDEEEEEDDEEFGGQETMITTRTGQADEFTSSSESQLSQYIQDTMVIREDQAGVSCASLPPS